MLATSTARFLQCLLTFFIIVTGSGTKATRVTQSKDSIWSFLDEFERRSENTSTVGDSRLLQKPTISIPCSTRAGKEGICTPVIACGHVLVTSHRTAPTICFRKNSSPYVCCPKKKQTSKRPNAYTFTKFLETTTTILESPIFKLLTAPLFRRFTARSGHIRRPKLLNNYNGYWSSIRSPRQVSEETVKTVSSFYTRAPTTVNYPRTVPRLAGNYSVKFPLSTRTPPVNITSKRMGIFYQGDSPVFKSTTKLWKQHFTRRLLLAARNPRSNVSNRQSAPSMVSPSFLDRSLTSSDVSFDSRIATERPGIVDNLGLFLSNLTKLSLPLMSQWDMSSAERDIRSSSYRYYSFSTERPQNINKGDISLHFSRKQVMRKDVSNASASEDSNHVDRSTFKRGQLAQENGTHDVTAKGQPEFFWAWILPDVGSIPLVHADAIASSSCCRLDGSTFLLRTFRIIPEVLYWVDVKWDCAAIHQQLRHPPYWLGNFPDDEVGDYTPSKASRTSCFILFVTTMSAILISGF